MKDDRLIRPAALRQLIRRAAAELCHCSRQAARSATDIGEALARTPPGAQKEMLACTVGQMRQLDRYCELAAVQLLSRLPGPERSAVTTEELRRVLNLCRSIEDQVESQHSAAAEILTRIRPGA
jgi:hypothetical protein